MSEIRTLAGTAVVMAYPARFEKTGPGVLIRFPDLPAAEVRSSSEKDPYDTARLALHEELAGRIKRREVIPAPSRGARRQHGDNEGRYERLIPVDHALGMKAILWDNMRARKISNVQLAKSLGCDEKEVRRLLDPDLSSRTRLSEALELVVGHPVAVTIVDTGRPTRILKAPGQSGAYRPALEPVIATAGPIEDE